MSSANANSAHWADMRERGAGWALSLIAGVYRVLGEPLARVLLAPAILFFYVTGQAARRASLDYLRRIAALEGWPRRPGHIEALRHFFSFGFAALDKLGAWLGRFTRQDVEWCDETAANDIHTDPRGAVLFSAHVGNIELIRSVVSRMDWRRVNVIMHTDGAKLFNDLLQKLDGGGQVTLFHAAHMGVAQAVELSEKISRGEWLVMMGDRVSVTRPERTITANFLGAPARFPEGPFLLAAALKAPAYAIFCVKERGKYRVRHTLLAEEIALPRGNRQAELQKIVEKYAALLEETVRGAPYQWFNFYDYWKK